MKTSFLSAVALALCAAVFTALGPSAARACSASDFGAVVDQTAQALRDLNLNGAQRFQEKLKQFKKKHGLSDAELQARTEALQDDRMDEFNREIEGLVSQMDALSQTPNERIDCKKLEELKRVRDRLLTVMGQKSGYMLAKADVELDRPAGESAATDAPQTARDAPGAAPSGQDQPARPPRQTAEPARAREAAPPEQKAADAQEPAPLAPDLPERRPDTLRTAENWTAESQSAAPSPAPSATEESPLYRDGEPRIAANAEEEPPTLLAPPPYGEAGLPPPAKPLDTTYSIEEIQEAGRGLFGTITAQFAAAVNYAFQRFGRPDAYITGSEGGAAFLAGLRYGSGTLFSKVEPPSPIYWQGPSLGYDVGAEGSSALFLVYNLENRERIYGRFTGIGGSAYVAGGVGVNVLGKSNMVMVPIRTGVGLRLGANVAYLKFTERQTWNPF